jgi:hypothetical protein
LVYFYIQNYAGQPSVAKITQITCSIS